MIELAVLQGTADGRVVLHLAPAHRQRRVPGDGLLPAFVHRAPSGSAILQCGAAAWRNSHVGIIARCLLRPDQSRTEADHAAVAPRVACRIFERERKEY